MARQANAAALRLIGVRAAIARHDFDMDNVRVEAFTAPMARFRVFSVDVSSEPGAESRYTAVLLLDDGDVILQVNTRRNCYDFQSSARVEFRPPSLTGMASGRATGLLEHADTPGNS